MILKKKVRTIIINGVNNLRDGEINKHRHGALNKINLHKNGEASSRLGVKISNKKAGDRVRINKGAGEARAKLSKAGVNREHRINQIKLGGSKDGVHKTNQGLEEIKEVKEDSLCEYDKNDLNIAYQHI